MNAKPITPSLAVTAQITAADVAAIVSVGIGPDDDEESRSTKSSPGGRGGEEEAASKTGEFRASEEAEAFDMERIDRSKDSLRLT